MSSRRIDGGESLIELLISVTLLGVSSAAVMGMVTVATTGSSLHKHQAQAQNLLRNWADSLSRVTDNAAYQPCTAPSAPAAIAAAGFTATPAPSLKWWNGTSFVTPPNPCVASANNGVYLVRLSVTAPAEAGAPLAQRLDILVRKPCATGDTACS